MEIKPEEIEFTGTDISRRINYLTTNYLTKIKTDESGWNTLYQDSQDRSYWEKVYLNSELHGGGPPSLINISPQEAKRKYNL